MNKLIVTAAALTLAFALTACSGGQPSASNAAESADSAPSESSSSTAENTAEIQTYMGQVSDKVGNDITVRLGEIVLDSSEDSGEVAYVDENGNQEIRPRDEDAFAGENAMTIVVPMPEDASGEGAESGTGDAPAEQLPIAFTGEVREFTIPAGAKITNSMGKEVSLDNVTKGSLVQLIVNETTGVVETLMVM